VKREWQDKGVRENEGPQPATALVYTAPWQAELKPVHVPLMADCSEGEHVLVKTLYSTLSRGTERLIFEGRVPVPEYERMRAPFQDGDFPFPVKYGYAAVGEVMEGPASWLGRNVFALYPHQDVFRVPVHAVLPIPSDIPARRAVLAANMETALNAVWDSGITACDRIAIVGAGVLGLLIASLATALPGAEVFVSDINAQRREVAEAYGAEFLQPHEAGGLNADAVFHTSATPAGLQCSIDCAGFEARIIELSWYGKTEMPIMLGGAFHSQRLQIISSQVGSVAASRRQRKNHKQRLQAAIALLRDNRLERLITGEVAFISLPHALPGLLAPDAAGLVTIVTYGHVAETRI
jgi:2-desacetyl-2-hydroxyethyl bacteriochlorophyllide A dehydrogenase